jgi:hypothetical protein
MRNYLALVLGLIVVFTALAALAQVSEATKVENARYSFSFTVEANSLVTYPENGDGFSAIHNPAGAVKGTQPDYGILVYGTMGHLVNKKEAEALKLTPAEEQVLMPDDVGTNERLQEIVRVSNSLAKLEPAGTATVKLPDGKTLSAPYYTWKKTVGATTHYALAYVVLHDSGFINVQVEGSKPFSKQLEQWLTTKLELLPVPAK